MSSIKQIGLLLLSSILLWVAWPPYLFAPLIFIGFVPLFYVLDEIQLKKGLKKYLLTFLAVYLPLSLFATLASLYAWGDVNMSVFFGVLINFFPVSIFLAFGTFIKKGIYRHLFFIFGWATMEIFQLWWDFNAPLFLLSNSLAMFPSLMQHYAIWGALGGSMYILTVNLILYYLIKDYKVGKIERKKIIKSSLVFIPMILSIIFYHLPEKKGEKYEVGFIMPHFNQYQEKFALDPMLLINHYNELYENHGSPDIDFIILPETAVLNSGWIENLNNPSIPNPLDSLLPGKELILGSYFFSVYEPKGEDIPYYVRYDSTSKVYFLTHNCAIYRSKNNQYQIRAKEKFIPFHDAMPYPKFLMFTERWINRVGVRTYITDYPKVPSEVITTEKGLKMYNLLCFEGYFSNIMVKENDLDFITVIANENWNDKDKGKMQFFRYMVPRAIEAGKPLLKVSNSGYSGYISEKGELKAFYGYAKPDFQIVQIDQISGSSIYSKIFTLIDVMVIIITLSLPFSNFLKSN